MQSPLTLPPPPRRPDTRGRRSGRRHRGSIVGRPAPAPPRGAAASPPFSPRWLPRRGARRPPAARREGPAARPVRARGPGAVTWWGSSCLPWLGYRCSPRVAAAAALFVNTEDNKPGGSGRGGGGAGRAAAPSSEPPPDPTQPPAVGETPARPT